jgi:competence protein ComEC
MLHRSQIFLYILLAFIGGVFLGSFVFFPQNYIWASISLCAIIIAIFFRRGSKILNPKFAFIGLLLIIFLFGVSRINTIYSRTHILKDFAQAAANVKSSDKHKVEVDIVGYISSEPVQNGKTQQIIFKSKKILAGDYEFATNESVLLTMDAFPKYEFGKVIEVVGEPKIPQKIDSFDYAAYLAKDDIFTTISFPKIKSASIKLSFFEETKLFVYRNIFKIKSRFQDSINKSISEPNAAFINGILLGTRSEIPDSLKNAFAITSTTHILAISGFNIAIVGEIIAAFFLWFFKRKTAFWFSILAIAVFTILTGAQASVVRAAIMGCLLLLASREGRPYAARNAIILAGAFMILISPNILRYDVGFQLSFASTLGLIYFCPYFSEKFKKITNFFKLRENLAMTISAQSVVLPLLLFYFNKFSIVSLPTNILVLPMVPLAMLLGLISGILGMILPILGQIGGYFAWFVTSIQLFIVKLFAKPSWASLSVGFPLYALIATYIVIIYFAFKLNYVRSDKK